ncbi:MAG: hypothetical protein NVSMB63_02780 [Sediminibacterium sp.]
MPVFGFALRFIQHRQWGRALLVFSIIHLLLYPSSNGYNSYMDRDTDSIGGIRKPMAPEKQLYYVTIGMDLLALVLSFLVSYFFALLLLCYITCSRLYSYRGVRLKRFPIIGYLVVIINQGAVVFLMVYHGASDGLVRDLPWYGMIASCFLIGGFYPITQVYQHQSDAKDGVKTISMLLGKTGTFVFCALLYLAAFSILFFYYHERRQLLLFGILQLYFIPIAAYFVSWVFKVRKNESLADFEHTMQMNWLASTLTALAFITIIIIQSID